MQVAHVSASDAERAPGKVYRQISSQFTDWPHADDARASKAHTSKGQENYFGNTKSLHLVDLCLFGGGGGGAAKSGTVHVGRKLVEAHANASTRNPLSISIVRAIESMIGPVRRVRIVKGNNHILFACTVMGG